MKSHCICILAHNEEKHIATTIESLLRSSSNVAPEIKVYANGCTDNTVSIVKKLQITHSNLQLIELNEASKTKAWNRAFNENDQEFIIFSDGDIIPEPGSLDSLLTHLNDNKRLVICGCTFRPLKSGLSFSQRMVGFMQIPFCQDFLAGGLYAIRRAAMEKCLIAFGYKEMPEHIVAEDHFLEQCLQEDQLLIINSKVYYEPPKLKDYQRYLARLRWQGEQIVKLDTQFMGNHSKSQFNKVLKKFRKIRHLSSFFIGITAVFLRYLYKFVNQRKINEIYENLISEQDEDNKLLLKTRSNSTK